MVGSKSHSRTNSRVPLGAFEQCCFKQISWARMVKILVHDWLRIRSMHVNDYTYSHQCYVSGRLVDHATLQFKPNYHWATVITARYFRLEKRGKQAFQKHHFDQRILNLGSTADSVKSKRESEDTPICRVWLFEDPHGSVVKANYVHVLRILSRTGIAVEKRKFTNISNWRHYLLKTRASWSREMLNGASFLVNSCFKDRIGRGLSFRRRSQYDGIVTGDEKWVYYDNPKRRKSWGMLGHASTSTVRPNIDGAMVMLCIWWG